MQILTNPNFNFIRWRWHAIAFSWVVILAGIATIAIRGLPLGIEFSGGSLLIVQFDQVPSDQQIRSALEAQMPGSAQSAVIQRYGTPEQRQIMIRVAEVGAESGGSLSQAADSVQNALKAANLGTFTVVGTEIVGPIVGRDLTQKGILSTIFALGGILLYIALRFRFSFAVGAVVATVHDLLVTLSFLAFFQYDLSLNVVAAILAISGYSVNDTIVIFDRVRENFRSMRRDSLDHIINTAVNQTLGRTILTAGTTLLSVLALFLFGGEVLHGFAFTMLIGIITGTYSTVYIASAVVSLWRRPAARAAIAPAVPEPSTRARSKSRKARAS